MKKDPANKNNRMTTKYLKLIGLILTIIFVDFTIVGAGVLFWISSPCGFNIEPRPGDCANNSTLSLIYASALGLFTLAMLFFSTFHMVKIYKGNGNRNGNRVKHLGMWIILAVILLFLPNLISYFVTK
jgi:hypothetical protein